MASGQLLTVRDVAERLQVADETVRRWLRTGELPGVLLGDRAGWRVAPDELARFLSERQTGHGAVNAANVAGRRPR